MTESYPPQIFDIHKIRNLPQIKYPLLFICASPPVHPPTNGLYLSFTLTRFSTYSKFIYALAQYHLRFHHREKQDRWEKKSNVFHRTESSRIHMISTWTKITAFVAFPLRVHMEWRNCCACLYIVVSPHDRWISPSYFYSSLIFYRSSHIT